MIDGKWARFGIRANLMIAVLLLPVIGCGGAEPRNGLGIQPGEIYIRLYPAARYLHIKEYHLSTLVAEAERSNQASEIKALVEKAAYSERRFGIEGFTATEESMFHDRNFITGDYDLLTRSEDARQFCEAAFSGVLGRPVEFRVDQDDVSIYFIGPDIIVSQNNSKGVFERDDEVVIFWPKESEYYEMVFRSKDWKSKNAVSIEPYFGEDVASPIWPEAKVDAWRRGEIEKER